ncbi:hypothetical protein [Methylobacterium nodulans]|uniref:Uncharacterized protein n=1 Tax=Methylobacterium nodulans (strain LMG 21967 / CNCM I-2342 / ORS 2060) TaxID=460265 RepID=B8ILW0_METNO|nr:hypothetical protein [Methylobacterium nodulans]ACL62085.1 hypothetical protein Mnod_7346 [Methylobacterium nodulans ORS 2060]
MHFDDLPGADAQGNPTEDSAGLARADPPARPPCTVEEVKAWLICAERGAANAIKWRSTMPGTHKVWTWPDRFIKDYDTRQYLKAWIWCEAHGESFARLCRERERWSQRTGSRKVAQALETIAAMLNFEAAAREGGAIGSGDRVEPLSRPATP